jgi:hypothetical protein
MTLQWMRIWDGFSASRRGSSDCSCCCDLCLHSSRSSLRNKGLDRDLDHIPANADIRDVSADAVHAGGDKGEAAGAGGEETQRRRGHRAEGGREGCELAAAAYTESGLDEQPRLAVDGEVLTVVLEEGVGAESPLVQEVAGAVDDIMARVGGGQSAGPSARLGEEEGGRDGVVEEVEAAAAAAAVQEAVEAGHDDPLTSLCQVATSLAGGCCRRRRGGAQEEGIQEGPRANLVAGCSGEMDDHPVPNIDPWWWRIGQTKYHQNRFDGSGKKNQSDPWIGEAYRGGRRGRRPAMSRCDPRRRGPPDRCGWTAPPPPSKSGAECRQSDCDWLWHPT